MGNLPLLWILLLLTHLITGKHVSVAQGELLACKDSDREALLDFKKVDLRNPSDYDSFGRYDLSSLNGEIRPSLTKLKSLKYLDLSFNTFDGSIPDFLSSLENLQYLNLSKAGFSGAIPPNLGNLSSLQFLDISSDFQDLTADNIDRVTGLITLKHLAMDQ
ncbi:hypothetical protein GH714_029862 [Hevea brasiliensis]|uniref:Leucine-rich repeat-containing N-terminal plant-type domain-containing protein n=1 Tax=Hevea brasiliensis TaxID=3981 RepID=A0A6A6N8Y8_HEVBR|nr:hypothetical protein GH714_029862 [Hevea brasiliensis]